MIAFKSTVPFESLKRGFWPSDWLPSPKALLAVNRLFFMSYVPPLYTIVAETVWSPLADGQFGKLAPETAALVRKTRHRNRRTKWILNIFFDIKFSKRKWRLNIECDDFILALKFLISEVSQRQTLFASFTVKNLANIFFIFYREISNYFLIFIIIFDVWE